MRKIYRIHLSKQERLELEALAKRKLIAAHKLVKARALLLCDESENGPGWKDPQILQATGIKAATLQRLRARCCQVGPLEALERAKQRHPSRLPKITGQVEAHLTKLACSKAPDGRKRWTLKLLAEKLVELEVIDSISHESIRKTLKKTNSNHG